MFLNAVFIKAVTSFNIDLYSIFNIDLYSFNIDLLIKTGISFSILRCHERVLLFRV